MTSGGLAAPHCQMSWELFPMQDLRAGEPVWGRDLRHQAPRLGLGSARFMTSHQEVPRGQVASPFYQSRGASSLDPELWGFCSAGLW